MGAICAAMATDSQEGTQQNTEVSWELTLQKNELIRFDEICAEINALFSEQIFLPNAKEHTSVTSDPFYNEEVHSVSLTNIKKLLEATSEDGDLSRQLETLQSNERNNNNGRGLLPQEVYQRTQVHQQLKTQIFQRCRPWIEAWLVSPRLATYNRNEVLALLSTHYFKDQTSSEWEDAMKKFDAAEVAFAKQKEDADSNMKAEFDKFLEDREKLKAEMTKEMEVKYRQRLPAYEAWIAANSSKGGLPNGKTGIAAGKHFTFVPLNTDNIGQSIQIQDNLAYGDWVEELENFDHWALKLDDKIKDAWKELNDNFAARSDKLYSERFPNGCAWNVATSGFNPSAVLTVLTTGQTENRSIAVPKLFEPIDERQYEKLHGSAALNNMKRRYDYKNSGDVQIYDNGAIKHYKYDHQYHDINLGQVVAMQIEPFFLMWPTM